MADPVTWHYSLRSGKQEELYVVDSDTSFSKTKCEALMASPDPEQSAVTIQSQKQCKNSESDPSTSDVTNISQQAINVQILQQLQSLG